MSNDRPASASFSPLNAVIEAFKALTCSPGALELNAQDGGDGLPGGRIGLDQVQQILLDPATSCHVRDAAWRVLARMARSQDPAWMVGAAGVAAPRLRRIIERLAAGRAADSSDIETAVLGGFTEALDTVSLEHPHVEHRLLWAAHRAGAWRLYGQGRHDADAKVLGVHFRAVLPDPLSITQLFT